MFYQFIISHHFLILVSAYCLLVLGYETDIKSAIAASFRLDLVGILVVQTAYVPAFFGAAGAE